MIERIVSRGFRGAGATRALAARTPPGQYLTDDFPVLSAGPTPHTPLERWTFTLDGEVEPVKRWTWDAVPAAAQRDRSRATSTASRSGRSSTPSGRASRSTRCWRRSSTTAEYVTAFCDGGYTTNLPLEDVTGGKAWIAFNYDGQPLDPEHGGPARLLVPHLYFWKSAKWVRGLRLTDDDTPGFWESLGYHNYGDPWREQRYWGD